MDGDRGLGFKPRKGALSHVAPEIRDACKAPFDWHATHVVACIDVNFLPIPLEDVVAELRDRHGIETRYTDRVVSMPGMRAPARDRKDP